MKKYLIFFVVVFAITNLVSQQDTTKYYLPDGMVMQGPDRCISKRVQGKEMTLKQHNFEVAYTTAYIKRLKEGMAKYKKLWDNPGSASPDQSEKIGSKGMGYATHFNRDIAGACEFILSERPEQKKGVPDGLWKNFVEEYEAIKKVFLSLPLVGCGAYD